jgi:H+/Cl- antiporter ClcA
MLPIAVLLLALACYAAGFDGGGMALLFVGAALAIAFWLRSVGAPRRASPRRMSRLFARH